MSEPATESIDTRRFYWSGNEPSGRPGVVMEKGWTASQVMMVAIKRASRTYDDRTVTYREVLEQARLLMAEHGLTYSGHTANPDKYEDDAQRLVDGRFGDMHRSGILVETR